MHITEGKLDRVSICWMFLEQIIYMHRKPEGMRPRGRPTLRRQDNIRMDLR